MDQCKEHLSGYLLFQSIQNLFFNQVEEDRKIIAPISATLSDVFPVSSRHKSNKLPNSENPKRQVCANSLAEIVISPICSLLSGNALCTLLLRVRHGTA